jgi:hypothetical protein
MCRPYVRPVRDLAHLNLRRRPGWRPGRYEQAASLSILRLSADVVAAVGSMGYQRARGFMDDRPFLVGVVDYEGTDCTAHIHVLDADSAQAVGQRVLAAAPCQGGRCRTGGSEGNAFARTRSVGRDPAAPRPGNGSPPTFSSGKASPAAVSGQRCTRRGGARSWVQLTALKASVNWLLYRE